ncbi:MAG: GspH/FimT family pseudopilin [Gammaproteobacteria bacterium]|nr:GspH/FimT family pseudopilin [Gammaproteobacteria bacterium]
MKMNKGFTLIELMVSLAVMAIFLTMAIPAFTDVIKNNRLVSQTNSLVADINLARSEAVKRGVQVILCRSANSTAAVSSLACGGIAQTWTTGWFVFASGDSNTTFTAGTDTLIKRSEIARKGVIIKTNASGDSSLAYNADGTNGNSSTVLFALCDDRGNTKGREIQIINTGRPRLTSENITNCTP